MTEKVLDRRGKDGMGRQVVLPALTLIVTLQVLGLVLFSMGIPRVAEAKTFVVNGTLDEVDANPGDEICSSTPSSKCTLRAAVQEANALPGSDTIKLKAGVHILTIPGRLEEASATGDLDILDDITILGTGASNSFINGGNQDRVFHIVLPVFVNIIQVTIQNGSAQGSPSTDAAGGGIYNNGGTLFISKSSISNNSALREGLVACGGGIYSSS